jgi:hypothetical protein
MPFLQGGEIYAGEQGARKFEGKGAQRLEGRRRVRESNRSMRFAPLCSLTQLARPGTVSGTQVTPAPGVNRPVYDKGAQIRLSGRAGNKQRCEKAGSEPSPAREARRKLS